MLLGGAVQDAESWAAGHCGQARQMALTEWAAGCRELQHAMGREERTLDGIRVGKGVGRCLHLLILIGAPWAVANEAGPISLGPAATEADLDTRIEALRPDFPAARGYAADAPGEAAPPFRLDGVSLIQDGGPIEGDPVCIDGNQPLSIAGYWEPVARLSAALPVRIQFWSSEGKVLRSREFEFGPAAGGAAWEAGGVYRQVYTLDMREIAVSLNGLASLTFDVPSPGGGGGRESLMGLGVMISPCVGAGKAGTGSYKKVFARRHKALDLGFRLGKRASTIVQIPPERREGLEAIGLISGYSYGSVEQDAPVAALLPLDAENQEGDALLLRSGEHTARIDYDFFPANEMDHRKAMIYSSRQADYLNAAGAPFVKHSYVCTLPLPEGGLPLAAIRFHNVANVFLDIHDVILLYELLPGMSSSGDEAAAK